MKAVWIWLDGRKTYIIAVACIVYGVLASLHKVPDPEAVAEWMIAVGALAFGFRSALQKLIDLFDELSQK